MRYLIVFNLLIFTYQLFAQTPPSRTATNSEPKVTPPDRDTLTQISKQLQELQKELVPLKEHFHYADVAIYAKAAEWIMRHQEWYGAKAGEQTLAVLEIGRKRALELSKNSDTPSWMLIRGKPIIRGYVSRIDKSIQPYSLTIPVNYDPESKENRLDVVLAGRDATKTEVKFIYSHEMAKPGVATRIIVEPYGRGNNAYRWAGETDVFEACERFSCYLKKSESDSIADIAYDPLRKVLRGFSMGGAGTWHIGLHHPTLFAAIAPGAGFTVTKGYAKGIPNPLPEYVDRCLHIYDAADYSENVYQLPVVAYSGEKDPQIAAAQNIDERLKSFPDIRPITHLIAPGLEHKQPPEWLAKIDEELTKSLPQKMGRNVRFVTYTPKYGEADWVRVFAMAKQYERAEVVGRIRSGNPTVTTQNVRVIGLRPANQDVTRMTVDGQTFDWPKDAENHLDHALLRREKGIWRIVDEKSLLAEVSKHPIKCNDLQGPIDDAFMDHFTIVPPEGVPMHKDVALYSAACMKQFDREWDRWMRGKLIMAADEEHSHLVLFGDPGCNAKIAEILPKLPITWSETELIVNGVGYDPKTHVPVLIYPNPKSPRKYVVINSGHTFHENDFKGTNALLYPRLGDWAVLKLKPTQDDPMAAEVVAAGLFDENWKFQKK